MEDVIKKLLAKIEKKNVKYNSLANFLWKFHRFEWMQTHYMPDRTIYVYRKRYEDHKLWCTILRPLNSDMAVFAETWTEN